MPMNVTLRKMLHRKSAEFCTPLPAGNTAAGGFVVSDKSDVIPGHDIAYYVGGTTVIWNYNADQDAWVPLPNSGIAGAFGAGACGEFRSLAAPNGNITNTASSGTTTSIVTTLAITRDLAGCEIRVVGGAGAGYVGKIRTNTIGSNAVLTLETASPVAFSNTTQFQIFSGSLWFFNAGTTAVGFSVYDRATNSWTARSVTGLPTAWGTDGQLVSTPSRTSNKGAGFVNGTATAGATSTITTNKTFLSNQWNNYQIRIVSGTGAGQIRTISSNTAGANSVITVSAAWATVPDATSVYRIEGNDDFFYLLGNNALAIYRYSISGNTWVTLSPTAARTGTPGAGITADWVDGVQSAEWLDEQYSNHTASGSLVHQNGRYIYSLRGAGSSALDVYDIAANTWVSNLPYGQQAETFTTGSCSVDLDGFIYIQKDNTGRIYRFDVAKNVLEPWALNPVPQGTTAVGDKMFITTYREGATELNFVYTLMHTRAELLRWVVI